MKIKSLCDESKLFLKKPSRSGVPVFHSSPAAAKSGLA